MNTHSSFDEKKHLERLSLVASKTTNGVIICDKHNCIEWVNDSFEHLTQFQSIHIIGKRPEEILFGEDTDKSNANDIIDAIQNDEAISTQLLNYKKNGATFWANVNITPVKIEEQVDGYIYILSDVTDKKRSDNLLEQFRRMDAIGQLVGGVAHDFNNILGILRGNLELLELKLPANGPRKHLEKSIQATDRAAQLTGKLLQVSQFRTNKPSAVNINDIIHHLQELLSRSLTQNIELNVSLSDQLNKTWGDSGDIEDVIVNLVINARDAMKGSGQIFIQTSNQVLGTNLVYHGQSIPCEPGSYINLKIRDTGTGIPESIRDRIFEPFFSTKGNQGNGLGLSMLYGFVKRSKGYVLVHSEENEGAEFSIWLPAHASSLNNHHDNNSPTNQKKQVEGLSVLVVDDEKELLDIVSEYLNLTDNHVYATQYPSEAFQKLTDENDYDILITDEIMPGKIKGHNLAEHAIKQNPNITTIIMSGFTNCLNFSNQSLSVINKPFTKDQLYETILLALNSKNA